jgi:hypothetical protein
MNRPCPDRRDAIVDYMLGALDARQAEALREHLAECPGCRECLASIRQQSESLIDLGRQIGSGMAARQERVIDVLQEITPARSRACVALPFFSGVLKTAVAAVLVLAAGIGIGRWTAPRPVDVGQLRADLESSILASLGPAVQEKALAQVDQRLLTALSANDAKLRADLGRQVHDDLCLLAAQSRADSEELVRMKFGELVDLIEAARSTDRQQVAKALDQIRTQTGRGLYTLAVRANDSTADLRN